MISFKKFLVNELQGSSGWGSFNPFTRTAAYGFGQKDPISSPFQDEVPPGGYQSFGQWSQHQSRQKALQRSFDLIEFVKTMGENTDRATQTASLFGQKSNGNILTYDAMSEYLRQLWNRTNAVVMTLGAPGTTPAGDNPERIEGAHFEGQGPHDDGTGAGINPLIIRNVDKRIFIGEASGGPQSGSWEIGLAVHAIEPRDQAAHKRFMQSFNPKLAVKDLTKESEQRFDIFRQKIDLAIKLFNEWNYEFQKSLASRQLIGGWADKAFNKMASPGKHAVGLSHNLDSSN